MPEPLVSVIVAVRNGGCYLAGAVDSVLAQTMGDLELIVVDDGSTDDTPALLEGYADPRLVRLRHAAARGPGAAANRGLALARGRYVARLDADDVTLPERLERQVAWLEAHPAVGVLGSDYWLEDAAGTRRRRAGVPREDGEIRWVLLFDSPFCHSSVTTRRDVLERHGIRYRDALWAAADYCLWADLAPHTRLANLAEPLVRYRVHGESLTARHHETQQRWAYLVGERQMRRLVPGLDVWPHEFPWLRRWSVAPPRAPLAPALHHAALHFLRLLAAFTRQPGLDPAMARWLEAERGRPVWAALPPEAQAAACREARDLPDWTRESTP